MESPISVIRLAEETLPVIAPRQPDEVRLFAVMHNEALRLPAFLDYYRRLGIGRFFIVDNNSTDATPGLLAGQDDIQVFHTDASFAAAHSGIDWTNRLLRHYGIGHWCLVADADELLVYPDCESRRLPEFCAGLTAAGAGALQLLLLDMYSDKPMGQIGYQPGDDLIQTCPFFDADYRFVRRLVAPWHTPFPPTEPLGGPRSRLFYPRQHRLGPLPRAAIKALYRFLKPCCDRGWLNRRYLPSIAPQMFKTSLFRCEPGVRLLTNHRITPVPLARCSGALLHFKYLDDFAAKVAVALRDRQFFGGSIEYRSYAALLERDPHVTFLYHGSRRYTGSEALIAAGLIRR